MSTMKPDSKKPILASVLEARARPFDVAQAKLTLYQTHVARAKLKAAAIDFVLKLGRNPDSDYMNLFDIPLEEAAVAFAEARKQLPNKTAEPAKPPVAEEL